VPWGDSPSCEPIGSNDPSPTWEPTKRGIFVGDLRPSDAWVQGTPTVDIHPAFLQPYPHALFFERGWMGTRLPGPGDLSIDQYWSLYEALPDSAALDRDKTSALLPLRRWAREHPSWAKRYPAPEILDRVRWHLLKNEGRFP